MYCRLADKARKQLPEFWGCSALISTSVIAKSSCGKDVGVSNADDMLHCDKLSAMLL